MRPAFYWRASRAPRYSLLFALPLLLAYQILAALEPVRPGGSLRNGADAILETLFVALAGRWGPLVFMTCVIGAGLWLVAHDMRSHSGRLRTGVFALMLVEVTVLAAGFGVIVGGLASQVTSPPGPAAVIGASQIESLGSATRVMLSLGAGIYEELLFRVVLVTALAWLAEGVFGWSPAFAGGWAVLVGAIVFSAVHYVGPYGDRLTVYSFIFRMIAGVFFSALYVLRGFGITAWTHALYDVFLLVT
jgi:hypothetical protein